MLRPLPYIDGMKIPCLVFLFCAVLISSFEVTAQWAKIKGPTGGNISAIHVRGADMYAATYGGFLYHSDDSAASWREISSPIQRSTIACFASSKTYLYAGTGSGLFRSADKGLTWVDVNDGLPNWIYETPSIRCLAMVGDVVIAGTSEGVCKSADQGATWSTQGDEFVGVWVEDLAVGGDIVYAVYKDVLHRSYDKGDTWHAVGQGVINAPVEFVATDGSTLVCGSGGNHAFRSYDEGNTWRVVGDKSEWTFTDLAVHDGKIWACTGDNIYRLSVNETEWLDKCTDVNAKNCYSLAFQGRNIFAGTVHEGLFRSSNGGTSWDRMNNGLHAAQITAVCAKGDTLFAGAGSSGMFRSTNGGDEWTLHDANVNIGQMFISIATRGPNIFAGATRSGISISNDGGGTWRWHVSMLDPEVFQVQQILVNGNDIWAVSYGAVYKSTDDGFSWAEYKTGLPKVQITSICFLDNSVFVGTRGYGVYRSTDDGMTWVAGKYPMNEKRVTRMISYRSMLFAGTSLDGDAGIVYRSRDTGVTWEPLRAGLPKGECTGFAVVDTLLFVSLRDFYSDAQRSGGLYSTTDLGDDWVDANATLTTAPITALSVSDTHLYVATMGDGIWKRALSELPTAVENEIAASTLMSSDLRLHPTVANAEVTIDFNLPHSGPVSLNIFNIQGECVTTLISRHLDAGNHSIAWAFTNGLYYVRLHTEKSVQSKQLLLIR